MNQLVLITGASSGIGKACAEKFAEQGDNVIICYNTHEKEANNLAQKLSKKVIAETYKINLANLTEIAKMFNYIEKKYKKLNILVNNAGISKEEMLIDMSQPSIENMIATNLTSAILCSKEACKLMLPHGGGNIINISSIYGVSGGCMESVYSACKGGLISFTKALAKEVGSGNIRVNAIAPGSVNTPMNASFTKEEIDEFLQNSAIKRMAEPEEIANVCTFLASEKASYITGETIVVDGGTI